MEKEVKHTRPEKREILRLNAKFDKLMDECMEKRSIYGDRPYTNLFIAEKNRAWKVFATKHNKNPKSRMRADPEAFMKHLKETIDNEKKLLDVRHKAEEKAKYDRWIAKVTLRYPKLMRRWNLIGKIKKDYVKKQYEKFQGKSPKEIWS